MTLAAIGLYGCTMTYVIELDARVCDCSAHTIERLVERFGAGVNSSADFVAARYTKIELLECRASTMASLRVATTSALVERALLTGSIIAPSAQDIRTGVPYTALAERSHKSGGGLSIIQGCLFEQVAAEPLVV